MVRLSERCAPSSSYLLSRILQFFIANTRISGFDNKRTPCTARRKAMYIMSRDGPAGFMVDNNTHLLSMLAQLPYFTEMCLKMKFSAFLLDVYIR